MRVPKYEKIELLETIAEMYYIKNLSQEEISKLLSMSRSNISKLLKSCKDENVVEFKINYSSKSKTALEMELTRKFKLEVAAIAPSGSYSELSKVNVGKSAAAFLKKIIKPHSLIGISWGTTLFHVINNLEANPSAYADSIQMVGGFETKNIDTNGQEIAKKLARAFNGHCYMLQTPMIVQTKVLKDLLLEEPQISEHFRMFKDIDIALIGLGSNQPYLNSVFKSGYITEKEVREIINMGAVADICGRHLDISGNICKTEISDRVIGISLEQLKKIPTVVGVASGTDKKDAVLSALRGSFVNMIIVDEDLAYALLNDD
jgi:deoxyribonucleoside regulator